MRTCLNLLFLLLLAIPAIGQSSIFWMEGTIHGYVYDPSRTLLKKPKPPVFEGTLENARISVLLDGVLKEEIISNEKGNYNIPLEFNKLYTVIVSKQGYNTNTLLLDTRALPKEIQEGNYHFIGAEFALNRHKEGKDSKLDKTLGRLHYSPNRQQFTVDRTGLQDPANTPDVPVELLERAIIKNNERLKDYQPELPVKPQIRRPKQTPPIACCFEESILVSDISSLS